MKQDLMLRVQALRSEVRSAGEASPILQGVSFDLHRHEILAIVGESGCGKSMTLQSILQLTPPGIRTTAGSIRLEGRELTACPAAELSAIRGRKIGMIFQDPVRSLDPTMPVGRQLITTIRAHCPMPRAGAAARAREMLREVGFPDPDRILPRYPHTLSGGQCQRVMIALALVSDPPVLLADEPTTALDVVAQREILALLRRLKDTRGMSILIVSHDLRVVSSIADRIAVMYRGRIVETGSTADVLRSPRHPYTGSLLSAAPSAARAPKSPIPTHRAVPGLARGSGCPCTGICPDVMNICQNKNPPYTASGDGHGAACWLQLRDPNREEEPYV